MYGKLFESCFTGSMYGAGPTVFAVWAFVIANTNDSLVEINPKMLAAILGTTVDDVEKAVAHLSSPDPHSRNQEHEGRRLVHQDAFLYFVPSWAHYNQIRNEQHRREYQRQWVRKKRGLSTPVDSNRQTVDSRQQSTMSTKAEGEAEEEVIPPPTSSKEESVVAELTTLWNSTPLVAIKAFSAKRKSSLKARLKDPFWKANWKAAIDRMVKSDFCLGKNSREWKADIDFFLRPDSVAKIMEGKYDNRGGNQQPPKDWSL